MSRRPAPARPWYETLTETEWQALPYEERETRAFARTGCLAAFPTWAAPVDCVHIGCQIARGEKPPMARLNAGIRGELDSGWWRFDLDKPEVRRHYARLIRALRAQARARKVYDLWELDWSAVVFGAVDVMMGNVR